METQDEHLTFDINNQGHQEVKDFLQHCRLLQYLEVFIAEGFESLPSVDINIIYFDNMCCHMYKSDLIFILYILLLSQQNNNNNNDNNS